LSNKHTDLPLWFSSACCTGTLNVHELSRGGVGCAVVSASLRDVSQDSETIFGSRLARCPPLGRPFIGSSTFTAVYFCLLAFYSFARCVCCGE